MLTGGILTFYDWNGYIQCSMCVFNVSETCTTCPWQVLNAVNATRLLLHAVLMEQLHWLRGDHCWLTPPEGVIRGPSLSIPRYYTVSFLLWIYFLCVWFDIFMHTFQTVQCCMCCSWHIPMIPRARKIEKSFSLLHMQKQWHTVLSCIRYTKPSSLRAPVTFSLPWKAIGCF